MSQEWFEKLVEQATSRHYQEMLPQAKQEYQLLAGTIYDDDRAYENRMGLFLEWFIFDRQLPGKYITLLEGLIEQYQAHHSSSMLDAFEQFAQHVHSLFTVTRVKKDGVVVLDLFDDKKYEAVEAEASLRFGKNDLFQGRLLPFDGVYQFTGNFCFHPQKATAYVKAEVKKLLGEEKECHKYFANLNDQIKNRHKQLIKADQNVDKITAKLRKDPQGKKSDALRAELKDTGIQRAHLQKEIEELNIKRDDWQKHQLTIGIRQKRLELMLKLNAMNLKWERSRQIDIADIYKN